MAKVAPLGGRRTPVGSAREPPRSARAGVAAFMRPDCPAAAAEGAVAHQPLRTFAAGAGAERAAAIGRAVEAFADIVKAIAATRTGGWRLG